MRAKQIFNCINRMEKKRARTRMSMCAYTYNYMFMFMYSFVCEVMALIKKKHREDDNTHKKRKEIGNLVVMEKNNKNCLWKTRWIKTKRSCLCFNVNLSIFKRGNANKRTILCYFFLQHHHHHSRFCCFFSSFVRRQTSCYCRMCVCAICIRVYRKSQRN